MKTNNMTGKFTWRFIAGLVSVLAPSFATAQSSGAFTGTGSMTTPRVGHTATLLLNGKVLVAGGHNNYVDNGVPASAELYDPSTGTFTPIGDMTAAREFHTATLLADGRVLIAGGFDGVRPGANYGPPLASAELYDPSTGIFTPTGSMAVAEGWRSATLLADGRVFVTGTANAEIYDPGTGTFTLASPYADPALAFWLTATTLADGRVLLTGCVEWSLENLTGRPGAELFDPRAGAFSTVGPLPTIWSGDCEGADVTWTATLLMNGTVLLVESGIYDVGPLYQELAEVYDPATGTFTNAGSLQHTHEFSDATLLSDGTVLITGGELIGGSSTPGSDLYFSATRAFASAGLMTTARYLHTATLLSDGTVLIAGGSNPAGFPQPGMSMPPTAVGNLCGICSNAEIYTSSVRVAPPVLFSTPGDGQSQGAILQANTPRLASSSDPAAVGEYLEIYLTGLADGGVIPPQVSIGGRPAAVSYFGPSGYPGVNQINVRVPSGIAPGPAVPVWLTYIGRPSNQVTIGVQ
jgi:hypothetical protein